MPPTFTVGDLVADTYTPSQIGTVTDIDVCTTWGDRLTTCAVAYPTVFGGTHLSRIDSRRLLPATPGYIAAMTPGAPVRPPTAVPPVNRRPVRLCVQPFALRFGS